MGKVVVKVRAGERHDEWPVGVGAAVGGSGSGTPARMEGDAQVGRPGDFVDSNADVVSEGSQEASPAVGCHAVTQSGPSGCRRHHENLHDLEIPFHWFNRPAVSGILLCPVCVFAQLVR